jgi:2-haloacid dehalogenase
VTGPQPRRVGAVFFDLFGTLLPLGPLNEACEALDPGGGAELAARWRARQLEISWLRTAMGRWADFDAVTADALGASLAERGLAPDDHRIREAVQAFAALPVRDGAEELVKALRAEGMVVGVLTNASRSTLRGALDRSGLDVDHALSVDAVEVFKPHPAVYGLAVDATGLPPDRIGFVTANGWDAAGAGAFGFQVAWLQDSAATFPPVGAPQPMITRWADLPGAFLAPLGS